MASVVFKNSFELSAGEIEQVNQAMAREFDASPIDKRKLEKALVFLFKTNQRILAIGGLVPISPVCFQEEQFSILGIGGIISNEKRKGYGRQIMTAIASYLSENDKTGVGFCKMRDKGFYEKCGFVVDCNSIKRFVFKRQKETITNRGDDCVVFYQGSDNFMDKVLAASDVEVFLPRAPDW